MFVWHMLFFGGFSASKADGAYLLAQLPNSYNVLVISYMENWSEMFGVLFKSVKKISLPYLKTFIIFILIAEKGVCKICNLGTKKVTFIFLGR